MIACLRSTRFQYPDRSTSIFLDLRRLHNVKVQSVRGTNKRFQVMKRIAIPGTVGNQQVITKSFEHLDAARDYWRVEAMKLTDQGLRRHDLLISGFHEED